MLRTKQEREMEMEYAYTERIINVDNGSFAPLFFTIQGGGMAREFTFLYKI